MKKKIIIGISGSIAAHKIPLLVEELVKDYDVQVVMTKAACEFVSKTTLEIISKKEVFIEATDGQIGSVNHVEDALNADLIVIMPASANTIGKFQYAIADNMLTAMLTVADPSKVVICPAMNENMYMNKRVKRNIELLKADGVALIEPIECVLASGDVGIGGLATNDTILNYVKERLN